MATLSLAMIVKDEERTLHRVLEAAKTFCDELIVVDTGSTDRTVEIATSYGAKVYHFKWVDDFAAARNYAFAQASMDWICWFDADDVLSEESQDAARRLKATTLNIAGVDAVCAPYLWAFNAAGEVTQKFDRERFIRRSSGLRWAGPVHESIVTPQGRTVRTLDVQVRHATHPDNQARKTGRNLRIMEKNIDVHKDPPHDVFQYACELQWNDRPADAAATFAIYTERTRGKPDTLGDQYLSYIKMADCLNQGGHVDRAQHALRDAIGLDATRAEAYCLAGRFYMGRQMYKQAWPYLVAACCLAVPQDTPYMIFTWFYGDEARKSLIQCAQHLDNRAEIVNQLKLLTLTGMATLAQKSA